MIERYAVRWSGRWVRTGKNGASREFHCYAYVVKFVIDNFGKSHQVAVGARFEYDQRSEASKEAARLKALAHIATLIGADTG